MCCSISVGGKRARPRPPDDIFYIELLSLAVVEGADAFVDLGAESAQLFDMREQFMADLLLVGLRKAGNFSHCGFKDLGCHDDSV
jgi:hypothetical protein